MPFQNNFIESTPRSFKKNRCSSITEEGYNLKELLALQDEINSLKIELEEKNKMIEDFHSQQASEQANEQNEIIQGLRNNLQLQIEETERYKIENSDLMLALSELEEELESITIQINKAKEEEMNVDKIDREKYLEGILKEQDEYIDKLKNELDQYYKEQNDLK